MRNALMNVQSEQSKDLIQILNNMDNDEIRRINYLGWYFTYIWDRIHGWNYGENFVFERGKTLLSL